MFKYTAVIVEPRKHRALEFVLDNFCSNLSNDWGFIVWHGTDNYDFLINIINGPLNKYKERFIELINLGVSNLSINDYNNLCLDKRFYEKIPTDTFMIFQTDTMINPLKRNLIDEFIDYDYIGAPWNNGFVGNGGLSIRKKNKVLYILNNVPYSGGINEDGYFSYSFKNNNFNIAPYNVALRFSIETVFNSDFFGVHAPWKTATSEQIMLLINLCPGFETLLKLNNISIL